jgi:outer membrane protein OmpA-like peptidoglycan-associated protein/opacity protein-like surface antigen
MTRSKSNQFHSRIILLTVLAALVIAGPAFSQNAVPERGYSTVDLTAFFGSQWYQIYQGSGGSGQHFLEARPVVGERLTLNPLNYVGFELNWALGFNRLAMLPAGSQQYATIGARNNQYSYDTVFYFTKREALVRPYVLIGVGATDYIATGNVKYVGPPALLPATFHNQWTSGLTYGLGAQVNVNRRIAFRYDLRGFKTGSTATFGLPDPFLPARGQLYINRVHGESSLAFTTGIVFRFGYHEPPPPYIPPPPPPPVVEAPPAPRANISLSSIQGASANVCPGDNVRLTVTASGVPAGASPAYQWSVNNQAAPGGNGAAFNLNTTTSGAMAVRVTVNAAGATASSGPVNVNVRALTPPTITFNVSPSTIAYGDRLPLNAQPRVGDCATATPVRYTASEGTIAGTTFDSSSLSFDANGAGQQQKVVRLTATETDSKNQTANANANVTVTFIRPAQRTDIVFPNRSSRVNNAAKRYLIEVLTPKLKADPNAKVILIGHRDMSETGRANATLDTQRVLNTAAVLSAGKGICPSLDLSRVQVKSDGTDQTDPPMPFADSSVKERAGQDASDNRAQFRRVEVWFVPGGATAPNVTGLGAAPDKEIKAKGCPR